MANLGFKQQLLQFLKPTPHFQNTIIRFINTDSETLTRISPSTSSSFSSFTVQYLNNTCGFSLEQALSASKKFQLEERKSNKHESVLFLFRSFKFSDSQIKKLLVKCPRLLQSKVHNNLNPKLQFFVDYGFSSLLLTVLISENPYILLRSLANSIKPTFEFLEKYVQTNEKVVAVIKRFSRLLTFDMKETMQQNIEFLLSEGVTVDNVEKHIIRQPRTLLVKHDKIVNTVKNVRKFGLEPSAPIFLEAVRVRISVSDSKWKRKLDMFKSFGWSDEEIMIVFKRGPSCLAGSEEKITSLMEFYLKSMKLDPAVLAGYPVLLTLGLISRILPRYNVLNLLKSKKLLKEDKKYHWAFALSHKKFSTAFLDKHLEQVPNLMDIYRGSITGIKT